MKINYYSTIPPPVYPGTEAIIKDIELLRNEFEGNFMNLYPFRFHVPGFPKVCIGMQCVKDLRSMDREADIHHVFLPQLFFLPVLKIFKKPVVCSVVTPAYQMPVLVKKFPYHVVVNNEQDGEFLKSKGFYRFSIIPPGINTSVIHSGDYSYDGGKFVLFYGSAPWVHSHFRKKGFDMLLDLVSERSEIRLVCLWRGVLYEEFLKKIKDAGVEKSVEVINTRVDVNQVLSRCHVGIVLAESADVAAAYPRSLLESLIAGMPIISSGCMGISDYIKRNKCGCVVESFSLDYLRESIDLLMTRYSLMAENAKKRGRTDFSKERMIAAHRNLYNSLIGQ